MRPLVLREIAEALGLHESTISRVTTQKYMLTPRGIYEFKYFFGSHVSTETGGACSATAIRALIKQLVAAEDAQQAALRQPHVRNPGAAGHPGGPPHRGQIPRGDAHPAGQSPEVDLKAGLRSTAKPSEKEPSMNLHLTGHHLEITPAIRDYVASKLERINRHFDHVIDINVILSVDKLEQKVEANVHLSGKDIHVRVRRARHVRGHRLPGRQARPPGDQAQGSFQRAAPRLRHQAPMPNRA